MKAVFVIDVDKDELGEAYATITANDITFFAEGVIRPLPNKWYEDGSTSFAMGIARGFNKCIDEIVRGDK